MNSSSDNNNSASAGSSDRRKQGFSEKEKNISAGLPSAIKRIFLFFRGNNGKNNGYMQKQLDKKLVYSLSRSRIPSLKQMKYLKKFLTKKERWALRICLAVIAVSLIFSGARFYLSNLQVVPITGGEYVEALVGSPQYINPLYAGVSDVDKDITSLVFSSLFKRNGDGNLVKDLVREYEIGTDSKNYSFIIRPDAHWHNGNPVAVDDIVFTFNAILNSEYKSPLRQSFTGVTIEKTGDCEFQFILSEPYAAFLDLLTFGIMPRELWREVPPDTAGWAELNLKPVGSGPYRFESLAKDKTGIIREYHLIRNQDYYGSKPFLEKITFKFFVNFEEAIAALNDNLVEGVSYAPDNLKENIRAQFALNYHELNLPQLTAIFLNSGGGTALSDRAVRQALAYAIDKNVIISEVLGGEARPIHSPILPNSFAYNEEVEKYDYSPDNVKRTLESGGWLPVEITEERLASSTANLESDDENIKMMAENEIAMGIGSWWKKGDNYLTVTLSTIARGKNAAIIEAVQKYWEEAGIKTDVNIVETDRIQAEVIKPRAFQALFYGLVVGTDPDLYAFWHSSQTGENGLNISNFTNNKIDKLLEEGRTTSDIEVRKTKYLEFQQMLAEEVPAIFMYSPTYTYVQNKKVKGFNVDTILLPRDRFANISDWYVKTGKKLVW